MVGTIKRWLGIDALERENLILARTAQKLVDRVSALESAKELTTVPEQPKIVPKRTLPKHVNWKQAQAAYEKSTAVEETE